MKKLQVIDLFAGAGGFGLGFKLGGAEILCSLEVDQWASDTLRENHPDMLVVQQDIREFQTLEEIRTICPYSPDVIIGGPPCQGFSVAGPAHKDPKDPRNSLFVDFARWVECFQPKVFVMENVKGLLSRKNVNKENVIEIIKNTFVELSYSVEVWLLNAAEFGVPQTRERIFVVGNNIGLELGEPPKTHSISNGQPDEQLSLFSDYRIATTPTLWNAISDLLELESGQGEEEQSYTQMPETEYQKWIRSQQDVLFNHVAMQHSKRIVDRFRHISWGQSSADVPEEHFPRKRNGDGELSSKVYDQNNRRLHPSKPSHTIAASFYANFVHPYQHRNITAREGARLQSFPDWYRFMGKKTTPSHTLLKREGRDEDAHLCQYNQIGNAVPPLLAQAVFIHIQEVISNTSTRIESVAERESHQKIS